MCDLGNIELKKALTELGLYETGMLITDMRELLNTINQSKNSATRENEYRKLATESNFEELDKSNDETIIAEIMKKVDEQETKKSLGNKLKNKQTDLTTDDIFDKLKEDQSDEMFPMQSKSESEQCDDIRETKSIYFRETRAKAKLSQKTQDALDDTKSSEPSTSNYDCENSKTDKFEPTKSILNKDIDVSLVDNNFKPLKLKVPKVKVKPNVYYHPVILNLPYEIRAQVIFKFHLFQMVKYKHFYPTDFMETNIWSDTIKPSMKFNDNLCVDYVPDVSDEDITENHVSDISSGLSDSKSKRKSNRQIKRKCYIESYSSDDDFEKHIKKTRSNCMTQTNVTLNKSIESKSTETENKWRANVKPAARPSLLSYANDRTKKIMNNAEIHQEKTKTTKKSQENMELTDDEDDIFNEIKITVDVHDVSTPIKDTKSNLSKNPFSRCRNSTRKREIPTTNDDNEILVDSSVSEITTNRFYNTRNQEEEADSIASTSETMAECPICFQLFKMSVIESHASLCVQFNEPTSKCTICKIEVPQSEMKTHEDQCINDMCETDKETDEDEIKIYKLCSVCDKYFTNVTEYKTHLKKCITSLNGQ